jgi:hypothetical protein
MAAGVALLFEGLVAAFDDIDNGEVDIRGDEDAAAACGAAAALESSGSMVSQEFMMEFSFDCKSSKKSPMMDMIKF